MVRGDLWRPAAVGSPDVAVVVCHGFKGFKDWGFFPHVAGTLSESLGAPVVSFNFSGSGIGPDLETFSDPEGFGRNTFSREVADLEAILAGLADGGLGSLRFSPVSRFGVLGHSRGSVATLLSGERPAVEALVTWAGIARTERYLDVFDGLPPGEAASVVNARTGQVLPLYDDVKRDILENGDRFDLVASLRRSRVPTLIVHGTDDATVPLSDTELLASAGDHVQLALVDGAGHTFEVGHPFDRPSEELETALRLSLDHFRIHLLRSAA